jgi:hypothetical protein
LWAELNLRAELSWKEMMGIGKHENKEKCWDKEKWGD